MSKTKYHSGNNRQTFVTLCGLDSPVQLVENAISVHSFDEETKEAVAIFLPHDSAQAAQERFDKLDLTNDVTVWRLQQLLMATHVNGLMALNG